jgi:hypothetical protein
VIPTDRPCEVYIAPQNPTIGDLTAGYIIRGSQVATCDADRRMILENWQAERELQDRWRQTQTPKPFWKVW